MRNTRGLFLLAAVALLTPSFAGAAENFAWQPSLETAKRVAAQNNQLVLIHFTAPWCDACRRMERDVFSQAEVVAGLQTNFVAVKINADHFPNTARQLGVTALPTTVVMTPAGVTLSKIRGRREANQYVAGLNQIATSARQQVVQNAPQVPPGNPVAAPVGSPVGNPGAPPAVPNQQPPAAPSGPAAGDRYADYYRQNPPVNANPAPRYAEQMAIPGQGVPNQGMPGQGAGAVPGNPPTPPQQQFQQPMQQPIQQHVSPPVDPMTNQQMLPQGSVAGNPQPSGMPNVEQQLPAPPVTAEQEQNPICLDGFCPVSLIESMRNPSPEKKGWVAGDRRWGAIHRGRTYLFAGPEQQKQFLADPDRYAPVMSGNDIVLAVDQGQTVSGQRKFGAFFGNRMYLFAGQESLLKFEQSPNRYANEVLQAMRAAAGQLR